MAEQAVCAVASAVLGGVTDRALTTLLRKLRSQYGPADAHEKLQRLEAIVLKLRSVIQVSEKHTIRSAWLLEWRDRLREAAAEAGAVVLDFQHRAREEERGGEASASTSASASAAGHQQQQPAAATAGALYFTRSALSGMAQRVRDVTTRLFSTNEDLKKLDAVLFKMERLAPDITQFLLALQLEVTPELGQRGAKRSAPASKPGGRRLKIKKSTTGAAMSLPSACLRVSRPVDPEQRASNAMAASEITRQLTSAEEAEDREKEARWLEMKLEGALRRMVSHIKATDGRDMEGLEWLAEWTALLREAVERGNALLQTLRRHAIHEGASGGALDEDGELYSFARVAERLVQDELFWWTYVIELSKQ